MKLNDDASFDHDLLEGTTCAIIRDDKGNFISAGNWKIGFCYDVLSTEASVLRYGLSLAQTVGNNKVIINYDNLEVVNTMNEGGRSTGQTATIFDDRYCMACDFFILRLCIAQERQIWSPMN